MQNQINSHTFPWGVFFGYFYDQENNPTPLYINSSKGGFYFLYDSISKEIAFNFLENVVTKLIEFFPLGELKINVIDFGKNKLPHVSLLKEKDIIEFAVTKTQANILFEKLEEEVFLKRHYEIFDYHYQNINEYNLHSNNPLNFQLLLINLSDFPNELSSKKRLDSFLEAAYDAGIYIIAYANHKILFQNLPIAGQSIFNHLPKLEILNKKFNFTKELFEFKEIVQKYQFEYLNDSLSIIILYLLTKHQSPPHSLIFKYKNDLINYHSHDEYKQLIRNEEDKLIWQKIKQEDIQKAYEEYLKCFPDGLFKNEAQEKINNFKIEKEKNFWERSCERDNIFAYEEYLKIYPKGIFAKEAKKKIEKIKTLEKNLQEIINWADKFNISKNVIPRELKTLEQITTINLQNATIEELPQCFKHLKYLKSLNLRNNLLKTFPPVILQMENLEELDLSWNYLESIPEEIINLKKLKKLNLDLNKIYTPPKNINQLHPLIKREIENLIVNNKKIDEQAWEEAKKDNSEHSYKRYLNKFPNGLHKKEAQKRYNEFILWNKIKSATDPNQKKQLLQKYLNNYPHGLFYKKAKKLYKKNTSKISKLLTKILPKKLPFKKFFSKFLK